MAITNATVGYIVPIFRQEGIPFNSPIVARWHGKSTVAHDASGGVAYAQVTLGNAGSMFGFTTLLDIRYVNYYCTGAPAYSSLYLGMQERSSNNQAFDYDLSGHYNIAYGTTSIMDMINNLMLFQGMLFRTAGQGQGDNYIQYRRDNVNGVYSTLVCGGLIYDERQI